MFQDELKHNGEYQQILEQSKQLREKKKSIENQVKASALSNANQMDILALEIKEQGEMLTDIALNMYIANETVEIVDEDQSRWLPQFTVKFKKEEGESMARQIQAERAESHSDRTFVPTAVQAEEKELQPA